MRSEHCPWLSHFFPNKLSQSSCFGWLIKVTRLLKGTNVSKHAVVLRELRGDACCSARCAMTTTNKESCVAVSDEWRRWVNCDWSPRDPSGRGCPATRQTAMTVRVAVVVVDRGRRPRLDMQLRSVNRWGDRCESRYKSSAIARHAATRRRRRREMVAFRKPAGCRLDLVPSPPSAVIGPATQHARDHRRRASARLDSTGLDRE